MYYSVKHFGRGLALTVLLIGLSQAALGQQHGAGASGDHQSGESMGMMDQEQMMAMHEHMQSMQSLMSAIREEDDPERRQQLMQEHMQQMHSSMGMMEDMSGGAGPDNDQVDPGAPPMQQMQNRMQKMQEGMQMMQMMMKQMMSHMQQQKTANAADN